MARRQRRIFHRWKGKCDTPEAMQTLESSEQYWYRVIQNECFENELNLLKKGKEVGKSSKLANLRPFIDEKGIMRANGRVTSSDLDFNNQPIILDSKHLATKLSIAEYHQRHLHASNNTVLNEMRQKYHIVGLRGALRSLSSRCIVCRLRRGKPPDPLMSALPTCRVAYKLRPFTHCGVDYFGPMNVKIGRRREKRWDVLFTCLTTRAIHLELAHSLSAGSAIMALQRLAARRGVPRFMYSDNGTNFQGASKELKEAVAKLEKERLDQFAVNRRIYWRFNPPDASHMGGAWERLIRAVKIALHATVKEQAPAEEVLFTFLLEAEHSVNSRPLTHVSLDPRDNEALTPNHFLFGTSSGEIELGRYDPKHSCLRKQWQLAQHFADLFWKRWLREYLPTLLPRKKWTSMDKPLEVGDVVLIMDLQSPRNCWRKGTISRVFESPDGQVRMADVITKYGKFQRPTRKLVKLLGANEVRN